MSRDVVRYEMDLWGNQTKILYPDASVVTKTYDALNRLLTVSDTTGTTSYTYTTADRKVIETRPNGDIKTTIIEWGKVTSLISTRYDAMLETDVVFFEQSLSYDEAGNVVHEVRKQNDVITTIDNTYNARGELTQSTQITGLNKIVYQYLISPYGNKSEAITRYYDDEFILSESKAYVYNHLNQLESSTIDGITLEYEYDDFGNLIEEGNGSYTKTYAYDLNNRLREVVEGPQTLQFTYDGSGNRLTKSIGSTVVQYVNDTTIENEQVLSYTVETDVTNIVYGLNRLNEDGVGYLSDSYGNIIQHGSESYAYTPYGELTQGFINGVNEAGYKGEVHDTSSLQYLRARTYNTQLKQFLQEDTYVGKDSHPLSQNRYAFVLNNPFKYSDPSGHYAIPVMMEDNFRSTPVKPLKVSSSLTRNLSKEVPSQKAEIEQIQTIAQKKVANVPTSFIKSIQVEENYQKAEIEQIQTIHKSTLEVIQKNDAKNEENMSRMSDSSRKVVEEQIKNREILNKAARNKEEIRNKEVQQRILAQQNEERNKLSQTGSISAVVGFLAFAGFMSIAAIPAAFIVFGISVGAIATTLLGVGFVSGIIGFAAGLTLHNTGSRGTDLAGQSFSNRESQNRKSVGNGIMLANSINLLGFTLGAMDYYNANKPTVTSNTNSSNTNQESNKQNQTQVTQDNPTDETNHINENNIENNSSKSVSYYRVQGGEMPKASQVRIVSDENGEILIPNKDSNLNVSAGSREHAEYFLNQRGNGAEIVEVELPQWFDDFVKENAIPQYNYNSNPLNQNGMAPKVVDPTTPGTSYELPSPWVEWFEEYGKLIN